MAESPAGTAGVQDVSTATEPGPTTDAAPEASAARAAGHERSRVAPALGRLRDRAGDDAPAFVAWSALAVAFAGAFAWRGAFRVGSWRAFALFDDAMISMRYAQNLAAGDGLVWNAGGERVEGITNPLWTVWMAVLHLVPLHPLKISLLVTASSLATVVGAVWVARRLAQELAPCDRVVAIVAMGLVATFYPLAFWALSGMEVGLMAWLVGVLALYAVRLERATGPRRGRVLAVLAAVSAAAIAVRLDAVVPVGIVVVYCAWRALPRERVRTAALVGGPPVLALAAMTAGRRAYYGDWLPNTYYLKATGTPLGERLGSGLFAFNHTVLAHLGVLVLAAGFAVVVTAGGSPGDARRRAAGLLLAALVLGQGAYSVWVGGDAWEIFVFANRYLTVAIVPLAALAALGLRRASASARGCAAFCLLVAVLVGVRAVRFAQFPGAAKLTSAAAVTVVGVMAALMGVAYLAADRAARRAGGSARPRAGIVALAALVVVLANLHPLVNWWRDPNYVQPDLAAEGWAIAHASAPDAVLAVWLAGNAPYFAERSSVDLLGKSDRHIARMAPLDAEFRPGHNKEDLAWSLATYEPDLVQLAGMRPDAPPILRDAGYAPLAGTIWVRTDSTKVDRALLARLVEDLVPDV